ncbi:MAG TPA: hypothetical protein VGQ90_07880 [Stellaceae bacterium]|nr:hypothetical protein [Stellaceae bacterium]
MNQSSTAPEITRPGPGELGICAWIGFWAELVVLGLFAVIGAFFASEGRAPGDYACGLLLSVAAIALAFLRLKSRFDGNAPGWSRFLLVDDVANLVVAIVVFTVLALAGLFVAARFDHGGLHDGGVALFVVSALAVFLSLKNVFDNLDRHS